MSFSIIGTGNMAHFLAKMLRLEAFNIGIYGRNHTVAAQIAETYHLIKYESLSDIPDAEYHYCFVAISDHAIAEQAKDLSFEKTTLIHTSGSTSIRLLEHSAVHTAVFWPIYSILQSDKEIKNDIPIAIEGNNREIEQKVLEIAQKISNQAFIATEQQRLHLHAAAVFANNFSNHLLAIAEEICQQENIAFDYLKPIIQQSFSRIQNQSPKELQTGPAIRGDEQSMQQHLRILQENPLWTRLYESLSASIRKMYNKSEH